MSALVLEAFWFCNLIASLLCGSAALGFGYELYVVINKLYDDHNFLNKGMLWPAERVIMGKVKTISGASWGTWVDVWIILG